MSEKLIELLMSWGIPERTATSQIEYLVGSTIPFAIWETGVFRRLCFRFL